MKLLIITQAIDLDDPTLSAYHPWILSIARHADKATVVCLKKGRNTFPKEIEILSLGKESKSSRLSYLEKLYSYTWSHRKEYDAVFVHMNQEYILVAGWLWKLLGKRIYFWRNHYKGSVLTNLAVGMCTKVFCTSANSYTARFKRSVRMPVGVSMEKHTRMPSVERTPRSILSLSRIAPSKNVHLFVEALGILKKEQVDFTASIYGDALPSDIPYEAMLRARVKELNLEGVVSFYPGVPNEKTPEIYNRHELFINISPQGMFDKTLLEAAVCGCLVVTANKDAVEYLGEKLAVKDLEPQSIADALQSALFVGDEREAVLMRQREFAMHNSSDTLVEKLYGEMA